MRSKKARTLPDKASLPADALVRPDIFRYHDYQEFLTAWLAYRRASHAGFSMRLLARQAGLAAGYLPMVLTGKRPLTGKALGRLGPYLGLSARELPFLEHLVTLGTSLSHETRLSALERMRRYPLYVKFHPDETEVYQYLAHWYYVAIRELAALPGFRLDPLWIQAQLCEPVPLKEVKDACEFLLKRGYLELDADGSVRPPTKPLNCSGGIFRIALAAFHKEIFELAARSIDTTPSERRSIQGHSFSIGAGELDKAKAIVDEAIRQIQTLSGSKSPADSVYHLEVALFPLTDAGERKDSK